MRRIVILCSSILCMILLTQTMCFAETDVISVLEELDSSQPEYSEIVSLEKDIVDMVDTFLKEIKGEVLPADFKIEFELAKKIYVDTNLFSLETSQKVDAETELENSNYV